MQGTGWLPDPPDLRDYSPANRNVAPLLAKSGLLDQILAPRALPLTTDLRAFFPPVFTQGPLNSCTAATAAALIGFIEKKAMGRDVSPSVLFLYKIERNLLGQNGDTGAFLRTSMQALRAFGVPPDSAWPYRTDFLDVEPGPFHYAYAANYKATHYFRLDSDGVAPDELLQRAKGALSGSLPAMFGLVLYSSFAAGAPGEIPLPGPFDAQVALHALVAVGYDDTKTVAVVDAQTFQPRVTTGALRVRNSWGPEWGENGYGWLPYDYVRGGLTSDWWTLIRADYLDLAEFSGRAPGGRS